jgi:hypothetical protein
MRSRPGLSTRGRRGALATVLLFLAAAVALSAGATAAAARAWHRGRTFYVATGGRDSNSGANSAHPWRTVGRVDAAGLRPGDRVLFRGGETFDDNTLMPGEGFMASGTARAPIVFASYGGGRATLTDGVWLGTSAQAPWGPQYLTFTNLALGPEQGFQGTGNHITLTHLTISNLIAPASHSETGILSEGSHWVIAGNRIDRTGDSGMLLGFNADSAGDPPGGYHYQVYGNSITNTGLDSGLGYPAHGIYLKVADATVSHNWIANFHDDGVSARYRNASIVDNYIAGGAIGIAWYQYDSRAGTSRFTSNDIAYTSEAGIFVCGVAESCVRPIESFVIERNALTQTHGRRLNLQPTVGAYKVHDNHS